MSPRVKDMVDNEYHQFEFPPHDAFTDAIILVRKTSSSEAMRLEQ
jgi:hypothetical protein